VKVLFRADASSQIGMGHVARCLTLARVLRSRGATVSFACRALPGFDPHLVEGQGFELMLLPAQADDLPVLLGSVFNWLVVDHYQLDHTWEGRARSIARRVAVIDDLADRAHDADLLLDQNLTADAGAYQGLLAPGCSLLLGPRYALLGPEFSAPPVEPALHVHHVVVSFGGFDVAGMALKTLEALAPWPQVKVTLLAGIAHPQWAQLCEHIARRPGWEVMAYSPRMAELMREADLFIGAGGGTTWERAALGVPGLCVAVADNQVANAERLAREGGQLYLGQAAEVTVPGLQAAIALLMTNAPLRHSLATRARQHVDAQGAQRVATALIGPLLGLRHATVGDAALLYEGRDAKAVRLASHDPRPLEWPLHLAWLHTTLADPRRALLIGEALGRAIGMLRYDRHPSEPGRAEVSLYLFEAHLGQGWGHWLLQAGQAWLGQHWPDVLRLDADVLPHNPASLRLFRRAGFTQHACHFTRTLEHRP
jgi:UDP-2,4-diacetamido-2,4,6-trideoxy-beta-L-altropyranose hydrolase